MERMALLSSLLTTGVLVLSLLAVTQGLELTRSVLEPSVLSGDPTEVDASLIPIYPTRFNLEAGAAFIISCTFTHTDNMFTVSFYKDGEEISDGDPVGTTRTVLVADLEQTIELSFTGFQPVHDGLYYCSASTNDASELVTSDPYLYGSADPPPDPVLLSSKYVVLDTTADLVLDATFRGNFYSHDWVYNEDDRTFTNDTTSLFDVATVGRTNVGQTYTITAESANLVVGYYGPRIVPTEGGTPTLPTLENTVIVGSYIVPTTFIHGVEAAQVTAAVGENVVIVCTGRGFPDITLNIQVLGPTVAHTIGAQTLMTEATPTSFMEVTRTVSVSIASVDDCEAMVMCTGSNVDGPTTNTDEVTATLQRPSVTVSPSAPLLSVGDPLTLTCMGVDCAASSFTFSWLLDGSPVDTSLVTNAADGTMSALNVDSVTTADFGTYTCEAMSAHGTVTVVSYVREMGSLLFTTDLTAPPMDSLSSLSVLDGEANRYNIQPDAPFSLTCTAESPENFTLDLFTDGVGTEASVTLNETTTSLPTTYVKELTISFSMFSPSFNGMYWCQAVSLTTTSNVMDSRRVLLGTGPATVTRVSNLYIELIPPNSLELQVMATGAYESLTWNRDGMEIVGNGLVSFTNFRQTLTISSTSSGDVGEYTAAVSASESVAFQAQEFSAPNITLTDPTYVIQDDMLTVNCSVTSFPQSTVSLSLGDTPIATSPSGSYYDTVTGLFIYSTTYSTTAMHPSDEGNYTCSATITHGQPAVTEVYSETVFVAVYVFPEVDITEETVVVNETNPAVLTCVSTGIPEPEITWFVVPSMSAAGGGGGMTNPIISDGMKYITSATIFLGNLNIEVTSTLTVLDTAVSDSGVYICSATNLAGTAVDTAELTVEASPIVLNITASPSTGISQGMPLTLTCEAEGVPTLNVTWTTPTEPMVGPVLVIDSVTAADAGDYSCVVMTDTGTASGSLPLIVGVRVEAPPADQSVNIGDTLLLTCSVSGSEPISYQWLKDGLQLENEGRVSGSDSSMLMVAPVEGDDFGDYQCNVSNTVDQAVSDVAQVAVAPVIVNITASPSARVTPGTTLDLVCMAVGGPTLNVTWTTPSGSRVGFTIVVDNVTAVNAGEYTCEVTSEAGTTSDTITISVQPIIQEPPMNMTVNQSSLATFSCTAQGNPVPTISWTGRSADFTTEDTLVDNFTLTSVLTINSAMRGLHAGPYTCSANNGVLSPVSSSAVLTVQVLPTVEAVEETIVGVEMMSVSLAFTISDAAPAVQLQNIRWTFTNSSDGSSYDIPTSSSGVYSFSPDRLTLTLLAVNSNAEGTYTLTATNEAGSAPASIMLEIESPPRIITPPVNQQEVNGVDVTFECFALAEPLHSLTWYFIDANGISTTIGSVNREDGMIANGTKYQITDFTSPSDYGRLFVRDVQFEDKGWYMCLAENRHGSDTASATLAVQVPPKFLSTSPGERMRMNSTDNITLNCSIRGYPLSALRWRKDDTPLAADGSHITITTFRRQDPTDTYPFSSILDSTFQPIPQEDLDYFEAVSELTLVPPLLLTDTANYTCEVEGRFVQSYTEASDSIPVLIIQLPREFISNIKLILGPVSDCPTWVDSNTDVKLSDIADALEDPLQQDCNCPLSVQQSLFSCLGTENSQTAVFLAELSYIALPGEVNVSALLSSWVASTPRLTVASTELQVDTACPVQANSSDGQSCVPTVTSTPAATTIPENLELYILIGIDFLFVSVLAFVVLLLIIICVRLRKKKGKPHHRRRSITMEEQDYHGPGYMVMENLTKSTEVPDLVETPLGTDY